jgi:hypothetical protein
MVHRIEEALVLRAIDFGESDRIVHLLTPQSGRINAIAKGAKRSVRRFPGTLDLFNHLRVQIARRRAATLARLEHTALLTCFPGLRSHPARFALGCYVVELLDRLAPEGSARGEAEPATRSASGRSCATARAAASRLRAILPPAFTFPTEDPSAGVAALRPRSCFRCISAPCARSSRAFGSISIASTDSRWAARRSRRRVRSWGASSASTSVSSFEVSDS